MKTFFSIFKDSVKIYLTTLQNSYYRNSFFLEQLSVAISIKNMKFTSDVLTRTINRPKWQLKIETQIRSITDI